MISPHCSKPPYLSRVYNHVKGVIHSSFCHSRVGCTSNPNDEILIAMNHIITQIDREKVWLVEHFQKPQLVNFLGTLLPLISLNMLGMITSHETSVPKSNHSIILLGMSKRFPLVVDMILIDYPIISHCLPMLFEDFPA